MNTLNPNKLFVSSSGQMRRVLKKGNTRAMNGVLTTSSGMKKAFPKTGRSWKWPLIFVLLGIYVLYPGIAAKFFWADYEYRNERYAGTLVRDSRGNFVGLIPGALDPLGDYSLGHHLPADHKALPVKEIPPVWWDVLTVLEDRHLGTWRSWHGIDFISLFKALPSQFSDQPRGASTLPMMLVRSMHHDNPAGSWSEKIRRKLIELRDAPVLMHELGIEGLQKWLGTHVPLVQGTSGSQMGQPLYGLEVSARILFGKRPVDLDTAEQAILAAAFKKPILLTPNRSGRNYKLAKKRWEYLKQRALLGLRLAYGKNDVQVLEAESRLRHMPLPQPKGPVSLYPRLPDDPAERFKIVANPERRTLYFAKGEIIQTIDELRHRYGPNWRTQVDEIKLTLDTRKNSAFKRRLEKRLAKIQRQLGKRLEMPLLSTKGRAPARVLLAVVNETGELVRYYNNQQSPRSFSDGAAGFTTEEAPHEPGAYLQIGSIGKLFSLLELVRLGDGPNSRYCNKRYAGVHNANGMAGWKDCNNKRAWKSARDVIAYSINLPIIWRLKNKASDSDLKALMDTFDLDIPPDAGALHVALPLGTLSTPPLNLLKAVGDVGLELQGKSSMPVYPHIVALEKKLAGKPHLGKYLSNPRQRRALKQLLGAPVKYGTLSALSDWSAPRNHKVSFHIGKTGTTTWPNGKVRDKMAVGVINYRGHSYSYIVIVGSLSKDHPLGRNISSNRLLAPMLREAFRTL